MFSTIGLLTALVCTAAAGGIAGLLAYFCQAPVALQVSQNHFGRRRDEEEWQPAGAAKWATLLAAAATFFVTKLIAYYGMPALVGPFGGYWLYVLVIALAGFGLGNFFAGGSIKAVLITAGVVIAGLAHVAYLNLVYGMGDTFMYFLIILAMAVVLGFLALFTGKHKLLKLGAALGALVVLVVFVGEPVAYKLASGNAQKFAGLANIKVAPAGSKIPPSDPNHLLKVTEGMAKLKGHSRLGALSAQYTEGTYTKQSVNGRRYWIAPLTLANTKDQWNIGSPYSPGYIVVDAEDQEADPQVRDGYYINLFEDQAWGLNLQRFLYNNGFTDGTLASAKFEVDDNWQPYWVVSYIKRPFGNVAGQAIEKVILIKLTKEGNEISTYDPNDPAERAKYPWVDRVMSYDLVKQYATDWGRYHGQFAKEHFWQVFFGVEMRDTMAPGHVDLCYTSQDENVWIIPMTNTRGSHSVMGVLVYETNRNEATWYPEINGFNISESVAQTMRGAPANIRNCPVESVQLMSIYGELTWVGIYGSPQGGGSSIGGIGFLHTHAQNAEDVVFAPNEAQALSSYKTQLANPHKGIGNVSKTATPSKEVTAKVIRITALPVSNGSQATWQFKVEGMSQSFLVLRDVYGDIGMVKEGDVITFTFVDTNEHEVSVSSFRCPFLDNIGAAPKTQPKN